MKTFEVDAWISTGYTFIVQAESAEEARQKVKDGEITIDYDKLASDANGSYWDLGDIHLDYVHEVEVTK